MSEQNGDGITLTVKGAQKRDAGRGVARLSDPARNELGVLSGDTVVIEGERVTATKVWPAGDDVPDDAVLIDADTRSNAGVSIGDTVSVRHGTLEEAVSVTLSPPASLANVDEDLIQRVATRTLHDRPVSEGEQVRLEQIADQPFSVESTTPHEPVRVSNHTVVRVDADAASGDAGTATSSDGSLADSGTAGGQSAGDTAASGGGSTGDADEPAVTPTGVSYEDIGGLDDELEQVREMIELPLDQPDLFRRLGVDPPKGVLLYGPPGTGKTLIAKAVANEVNAQFINVSGPEIMSKYKGESEERIREIFETASENAPTIIFFDEIDSIAGQRDDAGDVENRVVAQLLSLMDGLDSRGDVIVIGATNRVDAIDPALRRGGRFDREIEIGVPGAEGRREIFQVHTRGMPLAEDVSVDTLADRTHGFVGADVDALVSEAAMLALRRIRGEADDLAEADLEVTKADFDAAMAAVDPSAMREFVAETPEVGYDDVGGLDDAKQTLREAVEWPLAYDRLFAETNTAPPSGVLLYGPPGTGKTLLARALAGESDVNFVHVNGPELLDRYVGESEKAVREVFERARTSAPSIVFFDEIDAIAAKREDSHEVTERVVSQLLTELDGLVENPNLVVLAATNRKDAIDPALLRPGRLDTHVEVPQPDADGRRAIVEVHGRGKPFAEDVDLDALADDLEGYTGADLEAIVREASMLAIREMAEKLGPEEADERADEIEITGEHFERAVESVDPSPGAY
ncbi:transitional endoplasmic reticulum ATPase [Natronoarchaeum philippinense]|uniref:Transitional endoplasmic reticulum ATPase n=1 Tax=Natronoarchaeum philippinense TaxID=558529 RepID=A0A285N5R4_NATPI|nr:AAA family ATPase [Natronoarchaeum philippinense]SNZ04814.1 transitional endoplasmic reticulum ATPase [Natronoarchaeum philippinense]